MRFGLPFAIVAVLTIASPDVAVGQSASVRPFVPSEALPDRVGDFRRDTTDDSGGVDIIARYRRGGDWADVYLYVTPLADAVADARPVTMHEETQKWKALILRMKGWGYKDVQIVPSDLPLEQRVGGETIHGLMASAMIRTDEGQSATFYVLFELYGSRLLIRMTSTCPDPDSATGFSAQMLAAVMKAKATDSRRHR